MDMSTVGPATAAGVTTRGGARPSARSAPDSADRLSAGLRSVAVAAADPAAVGRAGGRGVAMYAPRSWRC